MIAVHEAFSILESLSFQLKEIEVLLWDARNCVVAETLFSPINMPPFRQATMDGYALALHDASGYSIVGEIKAGDSNEIQLKPGQAVKIFTGAAVPDSAEAVIQIEKVSVEANRIILQEMVKVDTNIRALGAQIKQRDCALERGTLLNPAAIGYLAGLGFTAVKVFQKPHIGIVVTGNELIQPGKPLTNGKVYESNAIMLQTALFASNFEFLKSYQVTDDFENTKAILNEAMHENDVVLVSGGISVGDYDFVGRALENLDVETLFYKVNQKPGKPLFVGRKERKLIFALPGNPAASLTCFYLYVLPTLKKMAGINTGYESNLQRVLAHDFSVTNSRAQFLKAKVANNKVTILPHQDSAMLDSFTAANALVYVGAGNYELVQGDKVVIYRISERE